MKKWILTTTMLSLITNIAFAQICQVPEKFLLRPTGLVYKNNKLYVLGQTYGTFYSVDLKNCQSTYISGGQQEGFVEPISVIHARKHQWIVEDATQGMINIKYDHAKGMLGKHNPNSIVKINNQAFAINNAAVFKLNTKTGAETVISDANHGSGPMMSYLSSITGVQGNLFSLDYDQKKIYKINPDSGDRSIFIDLTQYKNKDVKAEQPFAITASNQDLFVTDPQAKQIIAINIKSKAVSVFNSNDTQKSDPMIAPFEMFYDHTGHQLFVTDYGANKIDVLSNAAGKFRGMRQVIVSMKADGPYPHMVFPAQLMIARDGNLIVGDERFPGVFRVNPKTGKIILLSSPEKGSGPLMTEAIAINQFPNDKIVFSDTFFTRFYTIDANGDRHVFDRSLHGDPFCLVHAGKNDWYFSNGGHSAIFKIHFDLNNYKATSELISGNHKGDGPKYYNLLGMTWLPQEKKLVVASNQGFSKRAQNDLFLVDPVTGNRTVLSGKSRGAGPQFKYVADVFYASPNTLYVTDSFRPALDRVDIKTGDRTIISGKDDNGKWIGKGSDFEIAAMLTADLKQNKAYVTDAHKNAIFSVNLKTGHRQIVYQYNPKTYF